jgi:hypothetical protein
MKPTVRRRSNDVLKRAILRDLTKYCAAHPGSPTARRHPHILVYHGRYVALLGRSINRGILGFGSTVASALRAFDDLYTTVHHSRGH